MADLDTPPSEPSLLKDILEEDEQYVLAQLRDSEITPERLAGRLLARALHDSPDE